MTASTIDAGGFEAMEWYNIHASILMLAGKDLLSADIKNIPQLAALVSLLSDLGDFMSTVSGGPHADLAYLLLLGKLSQGGFDKWRAVQQTRTITGLLGSDIHRNVLVDDGMCAGALQAVCAGALLLVETVLGKKIFWTAPPLRPTQARSQPCLSAPGWPSASILTKLPFGSLFHLSSVYRQFGLAEGNIGW